MRLQYWHLDMNEHQAVVKKLDSGCIALRVGLVFLLACLPLAATACQPSDPDKHSQTLPMASAQATSSEPAVIKATTVPTPASTTAANPHPQQTVICVPAEWQERVWASIDELALPDAVPPIDVLECVDPVGELERGSAQLAFVPGNEGLPVGIIRMALVVPFGSLVESLSMEEAQQVLDQGSHSIEVVDWRDVSPDQIVLRVDGKHPGDADYPLVQRWALYAAPKFEEVASALRPRLSALLADEPVVRLAAVGDVMLDGRLGDIIASGWVEYPFADIVGLLSSADLAIGNLESALGDQGDAVEKGFTFQAPVEAAQTLEYAGFDVLSLANNHAFDYGERGLMQSIELLREREIVAVGAGFDEIAAHMPHITEINGLRLAILAYVDVPVEWMGFDTRAWAATPTRAGVAWADPERIRVEVDDAAQQADLVIVLLHSGNEFIYEPSAIQVAASYAAIEAGAHLVLGHHAQIIQGVEFYAGGVIAYGLGNLAYSESGVDSSMILHVWLDGQGVRSMEIVPLVLLSDGHPTLASGAQAGNIRQLFFDLCDELR
jgi:poly-gamma-glutamate synthesis protein (capsule biosynthesis protein)